MQKEKELSGLNALLKNKFDENNALQARVGKQQGELQTYTNQIAILEREMS